MPINDLIEDMYVKSEFEANFEGYHFFTRRDIVIESKKTKSINWVWVYNLLRPTRIYVKDGRLK